MKKYQRQVRNLLFQIRRLVGIEKSLVVQGETRAHQIRQIGKLGSLAEAEFSVFSQWGEDGILSWLVDLVQPQSHSFVEFGVEDYRESNTRFLLMSRNWSGLVIDGSPQNIAAIRSDDLAYKYDIQPVCAFIDRDNISQLIETNGFPGDLGILSVDIDGVDYWVLERIPNRAAIVVVEYNQVFGSAPVSVPYDSSFVRLEKHPTGMYWGASLAAFRHLLEGRGYVFAGTNRAGTNAFFVEKSYEQKLQEALQNRTEWPCRMREVRNEDGSLAFSRYDQKRDLIAHLPVVDVTDGKQMTVRETWTYGG